MPQLRGGGDDDSGDDTDGGGAEESRQQRKEETRERRREDEEETVSPAGERTGGDRGDGGRRRRGGGGGGDGGGDGAGADGAVQEPETATQEGRPGLRRSATTAGTALNVSRLQAERMARAPPPGASPVARNELGGRAADVPMAETEPRADVPPAVGGTGDLRAERAGQPPAGVASPEERLGRQLEARTGVELERGEDFTIERDGQTFTAEITEEGRRTIAVEQAGDPEQEAFGDFPAFIRTDIDTSDIGGMGTTPPSQRVPGEGERVRAETVLTQLSRDFQSGAEDVAEAAAPFAPAVQAERFVRADVDSVEDIATVATTEPRTEGAVERGSEEFVTGAVGIFDPFSTAKGVKEGVELVGAGGEAAIEGRGGRFGERAGEAGEARVSAAIEQLEEGFRERPVETTGATAGSLAGSAVGIGAASKISPTAGRGVAAVVQPGEEALTFTATKGLQRVPGGERVLSKFPGGRIDNEEIVLRAARRAGGRGVSGARRGAARVREGVPSRDVLPSGVPSAAEVRARAAGEAKGAAISAEAAAFNIRRRLSDRFGRDEPDLRAGDINMVELEGEAIKMDDPRTGVASGGSMTIGGGFEFEREVETGSGQKLLVKQRQPLEVEPVAKIEIETKAATESRFGRTEAQLRQKETLPELTLDQRGSGELQQDAGVDLTGGVRADTDLGPELAAGQEPTLRTASDVKLDLEAETEFETEGRQETEVETEIEPRLELELEQEQELETETETELELEFATELEAEPFGERGDRARAGGEFLSGFSERQFINPLGTLGVGQLTLGDPAETAGGPGFIGEPTGGGDLFEEP